jgi:hypothetical protein
MERLTKGSSSHGSMLTDAMLVRETPYNGL